MNPAESLRADLPSAVEVRDLDFSYGDHSALRSVGFEVPQGEIFGLLGPNGGGKTTLFGILSTLITPDRGSVSIFGVDAVAEAAQARRDLGVVFQTPSLDRQLRVDENLVHHGHLYGLRGVDLEVRIEFELSRFELLNRRRDMVKTLSGGLQRRVEIAKALLHRPRLLLLDEPSSGLDPRARRDLWKALETLRSDSGTTVLLTTHFIEEANRCDRLALIDDGELIALGEPEVLKREIGGDVVVMQVAEPESCADVLRKDLGVEAEIGDNTLRFEHPQVAGMIGSLLEALSGRIESVNVSRPTLEDVFLKRTGKELGRGD